MARGRNSHHGGGAGALHACSRAIDKAGEETKTVANLNIRVKMIAEVLRPDSAIATVLKECDPNHADAFLLSCHNRLKAVAEGNAKRAYEIDNFTDAMKEVQEEVVQQRQQTTTNDGGDEDNDADDNAPDYERSINEAVERVRAAREDDPSRVPPADHEFVMIVRKELGEKIPKKRARASRGGDDDEDDLEIVQGQKDDVHVLKCPITGMLYENPVKNTVCGHVYDKKGLDQQMRLHKYTCPVPGCANKSVSLQQVEPDEEMKLKVKRHQTREEAVKRRKDLENETMDDDDQEGGGFTVL